MRYVDFASGRPGALNIINGGFGGVVRYLSRTIAKNLDLAEFLDYQAHNVLVHVVYQDGKADNRGGITAGLANSDRALSQLGALNWSGQGCIYFVPLDANETGSTIGLTLDYFRGINNHLVPSQIGCYGDADTITAVRRAGLANYFWQSASTSFGPDVDCNMRQIAAQHTINGVNVDINNVLKADTGAISGGVHSVTTNQDDLTAVLNAATADGYHTFAEMFKIDTPQSKGIVSLLRWLFNNSASRADTGLINVNINTLHSLHDEIAELKALIQALPANESIQLDYVKLAKALIAELQNPIS